MPFTTDIFVTLARKQSFEDHHSSPQHDEFAARQQNRKQVAQCSRVARVLQDMLHVVFKFLKRVGG